MVLSASSLNMTNLDTLPRLREWRLGMIVTAVQSFVGGNRYTNKTNSEVKLARKFLERKQGKGIK
jgi:hypothetical protein